jgi:hypothetical protein
MRKLMDKQGSGINIFNSVELYDLKRGNPLFVSFIAN